MRPAGTDVARLAGVSQKTVSRVMNNEPHVREEVRERVLRAARQLGYRPNGAARTLISGRTRRLGVVSLGAGLYGPTSMLVAVERSARRLGYGTSIAHTSPEDRHGVAGAIDALLEQGVDGIVLIEATDEGPLTVADDVPVLSLGRFPALVAGRRIHGDERSDRSARLAVQHLIGLGHEQIRHVSGPLRWWAARDRLAGWQSALAEAGLDAHDPLDGDWSCDSGFAAGRRLLADASATAVFVANDDMAIGLIRALHDGGRRVPEDVSVIGMDDIPAAGYLRPSLTTIARDFEQIAVTGVGSLIREIDEPGSAERTVIEHRPRLLVRESTAAPRT
ncbi:MAG: LacI family DNA-binding transcriptional regulator [Catenulispora sp.]|nr:LacI family DNA-binding transcriptional regulator [Catenulispora sp.]